MKLFELIIDDGNNVYKTIQAAKDKKQLLQYCGGCGEFVRIKDITKEAFNADYELCCATLDETLIKAGYGLKETAILKELLKQHLQKEYQ